MRKLLVGGLAALTMVSGMLAPVAEAQARDYRYGGGRYYHRHRDNDDAALVAGIAGLAIGAALASNSRRGYYDEGPRYYRYRRDSYGGPRYYRPYAYESYYERPRSCRTTSYYDDWDGRYSERTRCW